MWGKVQRKPSASFQGFSPNLCVELQRMYLTPPAPNCDNTHEVLFTREAH